ncbi:MAG: hypothetical protein L0H26_05475, partial [Microlunatus sp.]|nr:hypothetical protein [Microlunatus sp.]
RSATPRQLRRLTTAVIVAGIAFGLTGLATFVLLTSSLQRAEASSAQLIRVQEIQTNLLRADANATNAFLVGGLEPAEQRSAYDGAVTESSRLIAAASDAEPADQAALSALNTELLAYTENIDLARANNRQGFPVGAQYLRTASGGLRADALPILDNLVQANAERAASQMNAKIAWMFAVVGLLLLGGLVWVQIWLARRFKRRFNVGLVLATTVGALTLIASLVALGWTAATVGNIRTGSFADVRAAATARIDGNDAKSNESLTLIARGSGGAFEEAWQISAADVETSIGRFRDLKSSSWQPYVDVHTQIRDLDDGGQWDKAVELATTTSNETFNSFDETTAGLVSSASSATTEGLGNTIPWLVAGALVSVVAGIVMAVLAPRGVGQRLKEYR